MKTPRNKWLEQASDVERRSETKRSDIYKLVACVALITHKRPVESQLASIRLILLICLELLPRRQS